MILRSSVLPSARMDGADEAHTWWRADRHYDSEQMYCALWESAQESQNGSRPVDRGGSEEMKAARSGLMRATQGHGNVWAAIGPHIWVHGPAATVVCFDVRAPDTIQGWQARAVQNWP